MEPTESHKRNLIRLAKSIEHVKQTGIRYIVHIAGTRKCCKECYKIKDLTIPFENILDKPILPYHKCAKKPVCTCSYIYEIVRDEKVI
jgi:hypothetical protein